VAEAGAATILVGARGASALAIKPTANEKEANIKIKNAFFINFKVKLIIKLLSLHYILHRIY
jgi:hypothetical protein